VSRVVGYGTRCRRRGNGKDSSRMVAGSRFFGLGCASMKERTSCLVISAAFLSAAVSKGKVERFGGRKGCIPTPMRHSPC